MKFFSAKPKKIFGENFNSLKKQTKNPAQNSLLCCFFNLYNSKA